MQEQDQNRSPKEQAHQSSQSSERQYTISISEEDRQKSFEIEDARWAKDKQIRDWLKLGLMIAIFWAWSLLVYFLEPGLR